MRFEKLNEDKIRITLSVEDLEKKDIDFHSFMSNSIESQNLFFDMLEEAEKEIGFSTKNYLIRIDALAMAGGDFVLTVTRSLPKKLEGSISKNPIRKKIHIKRKKIDNEITQVIYSFASFEDYCDFIDFFNKNGFKAIGLAKNVALYEYKNTYYLCLSQINLAYPGLKKLFSCIPEFASFVSHSDVFIRKFSETGNLIIKHNAILTSLKHFSK